MDDMTGKHPYHMADMPSLPPDWLNCLKLPFLAYNNSIGILTLYTCLNDYLNRFQTCSREPTVRFGHFPI